MDILEELVYPKRPLSPERPSGVRGVWVWMVLSFAPWACISPTQPTHRPIITDSFTALGIMYWDLRPELKEHEMEDRRCDH